MSAYEKVENRLIEWNLRFPLDRDYRKANNIVFGSKAHRKINQIDLFYQYVEDCLYKRIIEESREEEKMIKDYNAGKWLKEEKDVEGEEAEDLFAKLKIENMSNIKLED